MNASAVCFIGFSIRLLGVGIYVVLTSRDRARESGAGPRPAGRWSRGLDLLSAGAGPRGPAPGCRLKALNPRREKALVRLLTVGAP